MVIFRMVQRMNHVLEEYNREVQCKGDLENIDVVVAYAYFHIDILM